MRVFRLSLILISSIVLLSGCASTNSDGNNENNTNNINNTNNTNNTNNNTGACSSYCPEDKICVGESDEHSTCVEPCPCDDNHECYDGGCVDLFNDENNCGSGGNYCSGECINGSCTDACASAGTSCSNNETCCQIAGSYVCKNTSTDFYNCGDCAYECDDENANACVNGQCACGTTSACTGDMTCCSNSCKDLSTDVYNCGACGNACGTGLSCTDGQCMCGDQACDFGESCCGNYCADLDNDPTNCGECNNNCGTSNGCQSGQCTCGTSGEICRGEFSGTGFTHDPANGICMQMYTCTEECCGDGCKITIASSMLGAAEADPNNCGECGNSCNGNTCCCFDLMGMGDPSCECCSSGESCGMAGCEPASK
ncbi:MAG: hypothetical protein PF689_13700 [Deltaproteobacteria bacterium]|jgi:hypothetical protein|nr:hypothetical protein [Deltaproteobacteria bacterium]